MPLLLEWPIPPLDKMPKSWARKSHVTMAVIGSMLKVWADYFNTFNVYNRKTLLDAVDSRPANQPLITVSNHTSCLDDPMLWGGSLLLRHLTRDNHLLRWTPGASDVMFKKPFYNRFCALGRGVPVLRGDGVYQQGMDFALQLLAHRQWVHVFPEAWLPWRGILGLPGRGMRWVPTADEVGFYSPRVARFFALGGSVPTYRGDGVYQRAVDFSLDVLNRGGRRSRMEEWMEAAGRDAHSMAMSRTGEEERRLNGWVTGGATDPEFHQYTARGWVHIFPEGKINMTNDNLRLKWGVGRLVAEAEEVPMVLPMWHYGMDDVLPNQRPYIPRVGKKITLLVGEPMDFSNTVRELEERNATPKEKRKVITDIIQVELETLKQEAREIHLSDCTPQMYESESAWKQNTS